MDWTLEVVVVPVSDVDRAIAFYRDKLGFHLDHDTVAPGRRFAQLTPPGSGCSIVLGGAAGEQAMAPGSLKGVQLVVPTPPRPIANWPTVASTWGRSQSSTNATAAPCSVSPIPTATLPRKREVPPGPSSRSRPAPISRRYRAERSPLVGWWTWTPM